MTEEAKPATDEQIEAVRARLKIEEEYEMPPWNGNSVAILIARIDKEIKDRLAAEARADKYRHELWMRETGTSYTDVSDANPNGTFSKRHCFLCDAETRKGASQDTPIPHKPGCLLFGYEPTLALNEHDNG